MDASVVVLRPGALGDVLAVRGALYWLKKRFPTHRLTLVAPGERGLLLRHPGWSDTCWDWERSAFSRLFSDSAGPLPEVLRQVFSEAQVIISFMNIADPDSETVFSQQLRALAPQATICLYPSAPPGHSKENIAQWLCGRAMVAAKDVILSADGLSLDYHNAITARIPVEPDNRGYGLVKRKYAVLHPGSGSQRKNWPLENFVAVGTRLRQHGLEILVTSGEADGERGRLLARAVPGSLNIEQPELHALAGILAGAAIYIGNDSGVSHLASSVCTAAGAHPAVVTVFGPTTSAVWAPVGALVLEAGSDMRGLTAHAAWQRMQQTIPAISRGISE